MIPVTRLEEQEQEQKQLLQHALQMEGVSFSEQEPASCVLQICTSPRPRAWMPKNPLFDGVRAVGATHVFFRLIDANGDVYPSGITTSPEEGLMRSGVGKVCMSINGMPAIVDFDEFRVHQGRFVTSIPMTKKQFDLVMGDLNTMRQHGVRFNLFKQNCASLVAALAKRSGVQIGYELDRISMIGALLPHITSFPRLNRLSKQVTGLFDTVATKAHLPSMAPVRKGIRTCIRWIMTPSTVTMNVIFNLALLALGATKGSPEEKGMYGQGEGEGIQAFHSLIQSPKDLFSSEPTTIFHSGTMVAWQQRQKSTCFFPYTTPKMDLLPEAAAAPSEVDERPFRRYDKESL
jgi:hypothetical protein